MINLNLVDKVARALLYEGYILYPYRASAVKNRQRFNFGGIYPPDYSRAQAGTDACTMRTECLVMVREYATLDVRVRFLHLRSREIGRLDGYASEFASDVELDYEPVDSLCIEGRSYPTWQEAVEREIVLPSLALGELIERPYLQQFCFEASQEIERLRDSNRQTAAVAIRRQQLVCGMVEIIAQELQPSLYKVRVVVSNETPLDDAYLSNRDEALVRSLIATHTVLGVTGGDFISLYDTPQDFRTAAAGCENIGTWPVLIGDAGERDTLLSSPIILYDYPQLAPESAGELYDGTEIDEILTLRIMTLTDEEKQEMRAVDDRARAILERTEQMPPEQLLKMHGVMHNLRPAERTSP